MTALHESERRAVRGGWRARGARAIATTVMTAIAVVGGGCARLGVRGGPRIGGDVLPPVVPYAADTLTMSGRRFWVLRTPTYELYTQQPALLPALQERMEAAGREFARHFGGAPRVALLLFDAPAQPSAAFDFAPFTQRQMQTLAFVRRRGLARSRWDVGVDETLLEARIAELLLAAYADSVVAARTGTTDAAVGRRVLDRLPHWFADAAVSRVARPDAVQHGVRIARANRMRLMPLRRLFAMTRLGVPTWSELSARPSTLTLAAAAAPSLGLAAAAPAPERGTPPALLAAEATAFGEFLVSEYGPTFLQALVDELLAGRSSQDAVRALSRAADEPALERAWSEWLAHQR